MKPSENMRCEKCSHKEVCAIKDDFLSAQKAVENLSVPLSKSGTVIKLADMENIRTVSLECIHFLKGYLVREND